MHARQPAKYDIDQERVDITFNDVAGTHERNHQGAAGESHFRLHITQQD